MNPLLYKFSYTMVCGRTGCASGWRASRRPADTTRPTTPPPRTATTATASTRVQTNDIFGGCPIFYCRRKRPSMLLIYW